MIWLPMQCSINQRVRQCLHDGSRIETNMNELLVLPVSETHQVASAVDDASSLDSKSEPPRFLSASHQPTQSRQHW